MLKNKVSLLLCLILSQWVFGVSTSFAANEYARPVIFSGAGLPYGRCKIVTIHSLTEAKGQVYSQSGVGWFVSGEEGYRLLTPAHVVSGADALLAECLGQFFPVQLQSRSETLDLALLKPLSDVSSFAYPLIYLKTREQALALMSPADRIGLKSFHPDHFTKPLESLVKLQMTNSYQLPGPDSQTPMIKIRSSDGDITKMGIAHYENGINSLIVETLGIQPGYSGAPLFAHINKPDFSDTDFLVNTLSGDGDYTTLFLMGMLTRTEVNGSRALGISLPMILKALPYLMSSQNPHTDAYAQALGLRVRLQYTNAIKNKVLERSQQLIDDTSGARKVYSEICEDETLESSEWSANSAASSQSLNKLVQQYKTLASDSQKRPQLEKIADQYKVQSRDLRSFQQKSGGGDYGEGGGSSASLKNGQLMIPDRNVYYHGGYYTLTAYKLNKPCQKVSLQDESGKIFDALMVQGRLTKATSLAEAFDALSKGAQLGTANSTPLCKALNLYASKMDSIETQYPGPNGKSLIHARSEGYVQDGAPRSTRLGTLRCSIESSPSGPLSKVDIDFQQQNMRMQVTLGDVKNPRGFIHLENPACGVQLSTKNYTMANRWKHQIRSEMMDVDVNLNTEGRVLSIKVLRAAPVCAHKSGTLLWMQEVHFNDLDSLIKKTTFGGKSFYEKVKARLY